jgi:hypothetical protein
MLNNIGFPMSTKQTERAAGHAVCNAVLDFCRKGMDLKLFENVLAVE